jgi:hypothetical protein
MRDDATAIESMEVRYDNFKNNRKIKVGYTQGKVYDDISFPSV